MVVRQLKCASCDLSKASKQKLVSKDPQPRSKGRSKQFKIRKEDLDPRQRASIDQYQSTNSRSGPGSRLKEEKKFCGGTLFYDHRTAYIYICHQFSLDAEETV